jgi:hypothetical protein
LEFCSKQKQSALDMVRDREAVRGNIGVAQRKTQGQRLFSALGVVETVSDTQISHGCVGFVFKIYSSKHAPNWKRQHLENRAKKFEFQNTFETLKQKNNLFFKE